MSVAAICCSHSPLMLRGGDDPGDEAKRAVRQAFGQLADWTRAFAPDVVAVFAPDHYNGLFYDLMPPFCIGVGARSTRDWGIPRTQLDVPEDLALQCAQAIRRADIDIAISHDLWVDHGTTIPLMYLAGGIDAVPVLPVVINCIAPPCPTFRRVRRLGEAVGRFLAASGRRVLVIGSGGLSHAPPTPALATAKGEDRLRLTRRHEPTAEDYEKRQARVYRAAESLQGPSPLILPPSENWDRRFLEHLLTGDFDAVERFDETPIEREAGHGAHEVRCWMAAAAAAHAAGVAAFELDCYRLVPDWITGMGLAHTPAR